MKNTVKTKDTKSSSTMNVDPLTSSDSLPYNPNNKLLPETEIFRVLNSYAESIRVRDVNLFRKAMVHRSYCTRKNENFVNGNLQCPEQCIPLQEESNERLEFLGDAVLNLVVGAYLFERYPDENEGFLTKLRTKLVNGKMLGHLFSLLELDQYILVSKQIDENQGRNNYKIQEDCFEALLGALYVDQQPDGYKAVETWLVNFIEDNVDFSDLIIHYNNYKDTLLKFCQHTYSYLPKFVELSIENVGQSKMYTICLKDRNDQIIGTGKALTKKMAENEAARDALIYYGQPIAVGGMEALCK
jgi:ribonuclease III